MFADNQLSTNYYNACMSEIPLRDLIDQANELIRVSRIAIEQIQHEHVRSQKLLDISYKNLYASDRQLSQIDTLMQRTSSTLNQPAVSNR